MVFAPAAPPQHDVAGGPLREVLAGLAAAHTDARDPSAMADGRAALARATASLARLLDRRVELVDVGASASTRILADPSGVLGQVVRVDAALAPREAIGDDAVADRVLAWSTIRADPATLRDRVRNLVVAPWRDAAGDGARLRLAAGRAALAHLDDGWRLPASADGRQADYTADLLIVSGGAFAGAPAPAISLALVDTLRRPGAMALAHDHARILAPIGALENEEDRQRLLADLLEDALAPLGSAIVATGVHSGRHRGSLRLTTTDGASEQVELVAGGVQLLRSAAGAGGERRTDHARRRLARGPIAPPVGRRRRRAGRPARRHAQDPPCGCPTGPSADATCSMPGSDHCGRGPRRDRRGATAGDAHRAGGCGGRRTGHPDPSGIGDRPLIAAGVHVTAGAPIAERLRDPELAETRLAGIQEPEPGALLEDGAALGGKRRQGQLRPATAGSSTSRPAARCARSSVDTSRSCRRRRPGSSRPCWPRPSCCAPTASASRAR